MLDVRRLFAVTMAVTAAACSSGVAPGPDGGGGPDATADQGSGGDSGPAGTDAGATESGGPTDAGSAVDAGGEVDAGDAGDADAAMAVDADAATESTAGDAGVCATCTGGEVCLENQTLGGALLLPDDAGQCAPGLVLDDAGVGHCVAPPTFRCAPLPSACFPTGSLAPAHCVCAPSLCPAPAICTDVSPALMQCVQAVP